MKKLLEILLNQYSSGPDMQKAGLCAAVFYLNGSTVIGRRARAELLEYIEANPPKSALHIDSVDDFYWPRGKVAPRIAWLKEHIKLNSLCTL